MYEKTTRGVRVIAKPQFLEGQSQPDQGKYVWAYTIVIENHGVESVTLKTRHWIISDGQGGRQEVKGEGVIGEQPVLKPGDSFQYTSGCPLPTPSGIMVGSYGMVGAGGEPFEVAIPAFSLDSPYDRRSVN
jgi:ApaG protein